MLSEIKSEYQRNSLIFLINVKKKYIYIIYKLGKKRNTSFVEEFKILSEYQP